MHCLRVAAAGDEARVGAIVAAVCVASQAHRLTSRVRPLPARLARASGLCANARGPARSAHPAASRCYAGISQSCAPLAQGTRLSPWLAFGCITARAVMEEVRKYERVRGKPGGDGRGKTTTTYRLYKDLATRERAA